MSYWQNFSIAVVSAIIGGYISFKIAKYQVDKSEKQQQSQKDEEIKRQKLFMLDELKLQYAQKIIESTRVVNNNIINILNRIDTIRLIDTSNALSDERTPKTEIFTQEQRLDFLTEFEEVQDYLSNLYTVLEMFNFDEDDKEVFNELMEKLNLFYDPDYIKRNLYSLPKVEEYIFLINDFDQKVRKKHIDLIQSMKAKEY